MTFETEALNKAMKLNVIVEIPSLSYEFAQYTPDSGLTPTHVGYIGTAKINPINLDIRRVNTTTSTLNFDLIDFNKDITTLIMNDTNQFMEREVILKVGFITGSFAYSSYRQFAKSTIKSWQKIDSKFRFTCNDITELLKDEYKNYYSELSSDISAVDTSVTLDDATNFPSSGQIKINSEFLLYSGKSVNTLTGLSRADLTSTADAAETGDKCSLVTKFEKNPIDIMTDVFTELGISSDVDLTSFSDIKATHFSSDTYRLYWYDVDNALERIEQEVLLAINCRLAPIDGKITLVILDQVDLSATPFIVDEDSITTKQPSYKADTKRLINQVQIKYNYSEGLSKFTRTKLYPLSGTSESIVAFGAKKPLKLEFKGVAADLNGDTIAAERATRLLARLDRPVTDLKLQTHFDTSSLNVGDDVNLVHGNLPSKSGSFNEILEVMKQGYDFTSGLITYQYSFTSATGLRLGQIAPNDSIQSVTSQSVFTVSDGTCFAADYFLIIDGETQQVDSVSGNILTMKAPYTTTLIAQDIVFPDYDNSSDGQRSRWAYTCNNTESFTYDSNSGYQIYF